jgi:hypothetical protein
MRSSELAMQLVWSAVEGYLYIDLQCLHPQWSTIMHSSELAMQLVCSCTGYLYMDLSETAPTR